MPSQRIIEMSASDHKTQAHNDPSTAHIVRQQRGVPQELMDCSREQAKTYRMICGALKHGPMTIQEIHSATGIPTDKVFWYLTAWKKYGKIVEGEQCEDYYQYALAQEETM
jgi:hypothetical protein